MNESKLVNGMERSGEVILDEASDDFDREYSNLIDKSDAVYIATHSDYRPPQIEKALQSGVHVLYELPIAKNENECLRLQGIALSNSRVLMDAIKTADAAAYAGLLLLAKSGRIGWVVSVDAVCSSLTKPEYVGKQGVMDRWGPTAFLPIVQLPGSDWVKSSYAALLSRDDSSHDTFVKADFAYQEAVASFKLASAVKAEGELVIAGTEGYIYVPSHWWKTDCFGIRREDPNENKLYFYQLDGEGVRYN